MLVAVIFSTQMPHGSFDGKWTSRRYGEETD